MDKNTRSRKWCIVAHLEDLGLQLLKNALKSEPNGKNGLKIALIKHDLDLNEDGSIKLEHYHAIIEFENARTFQSMKSTFEGCHIEKAENWTACVQYLTHKNDLNKHQYDFASIETNDPKWLELEYNKELKTSMQQQELELMSNILKGKYSNMFDLIVSQDFDLLFIQRRMKVIETLFDGLRDREIDKAIKAKGYKQE